MKNIFTFLKDKKIMSSKMLFKLTEKTYKSHAKATEKAIKNYYFYQIKPVTASAAVNGEYSIKIRIKKHNKNFSTNQLIKWMQKNKIDVLLYESGETEDIILIEWAEGLK